MYAVHPYDAVCCPALPTPACFEIKQTGHAPCCKARMHARTCLPAPETHPLCRSQVLALLAMSIGQQPCAPGDLAHDEASAAVRCAVLEGLGLLADNPLTHALLKPALPKIAPCLGDAALKVRVAMADLLLGIG